MSPEIAAKLEEMTRRHERAEMKFLSQALKLSQDEIEHVIQIRDQASERISASLHDLRGPEQAMDATTDMHALIKERDERISSVMGPENYAKYAEFLRDQAREKGTLLGFPDSTP
jgi:hypothetical protein